MSAETLGLYPNNLREYRRRAGYTQRRFGQAVGLADTLISLIERGGQELKLSRAEQFAQILGCQPYDLINTAAAGISSADLAVDRAFRLEYVARAGYWAGRQKLADPDQQTLLLPDDTRYAGVTRYGIRISDSTINNALPPGSIAICISFHDLVRQPREHELIHFERRSADDEYEQSIRRFGYDANGRQVISTDTNNQALSSTIQCNPPIGITDLHPDDDWPDDGPYCRPMGLVIGCYHEL